MVEAAEFVAQQQGEPQSAGEGGAALGTLLLRGYVRGLGLSANQAVHVSGAGDFQLAQIDGPPEVPAANDSPEAARRQQAVAAAGAAAMDLSAAEGFGGLPVLARPQPGQQESLVRENEVDPLAGEQTWPTEEVGVGRCCCRVRFFGAAQAAAAAAATAAAAQEKNIIRMRLGLLECHSAVR